MVPFLLLVLSIITGNTHAFTIPRIVGGYEASIKDFPYIVSIQINNVHYCGGVIIKPDMVVTAAHCITGPFPYVIKAGTDNILEKGEQRRVVAKAIHPNYNAKKLKNDVAVLRLESPLNYIQGKIQNVNLPKYSRSVPLSWGKVAGWGYTYDPLEHNTKLRALDLEVYSQDECEAIVPNFQISEEKFCAGHFSGVKDSCNGDSGGPFVINNTLYGVVSYGSEYCAVGKPGVYTNIPYLVDWIKEVAEITN